MPTLGHTSGPEKTTGIIAGIVDSLGLRRDNRTEILSRRTGILGRSPPPSAAPHLTRSLGLGVTLPPCWVSRPTVASIPTKPA